MSRWTSCRRRSRIASGDAGPTFVNDEGAAERQSGTCRSRGTGHRPGAREGEGTCDDEGARERGVEGKKAE